MSSALTVVGPAGPETVAAQDVLSGIALTIRPETCTFSSGGKAGSRNPLKTIAYWVADWYSTCRSMDSSLDAFRMVTVGVKVLSYLANGSNFGLIGTTARQ